MKITENRDKQKECTVEIIAWLHQVWLLHEQYQNISSDPFYDRNDKFTTEMVNDTIDKLEEIFLYELQHYPQYHNTAQGISPGEKLMPPGFDKYSYEQKFAIVQGIDKICCKYRSSNIVI